LKITYTEEAVADIVEAIGFLKERNPTAAANLDTAIARCIERLAIGNSRGLCHALGLVLAYGAGVFGHSESTTNATLTNS
jgi:plasmid stabilization system protein ParE